jgi:MHS family metabolite:H+ symporter-like MFS transporter
METKMTGQVAALHSTATTTGTEVAVTGKDLQRVIGASVAGSAMEWYDFSIYGTASALTFSDLFFPGLDKAAGLLAIFGAYAAGFFARPFGGLFFGWLGDKYGRKSVLAEQAGASLIVSEFAPSARRGFYAAMPFAGCIVGRFQA